MAITGDDGVYAFQFQRFGAGVVLQIHRAIVVAVQTRIGQQFNAQALRGGGQLIAHIQRQGFAQTQAIDGDADVKALLHQQFGDAWRHPIAAPIGNQHRFALRGRALQILPCVQFQNAVVGFYRLRIRRGTCCQHHHIGGFGLHHCQIHTRVQLNVDVLLGHGLEQIGNQAAKLGAARQILCQQSLAAQLFAAFIQADTVTALRRNQSRIHARWATADDHDFFRRSSGL